MKTRAGLRDEYGPEGRITCEACGASWFCHALAWSMYGGPGSRCTKCNERFVLEWEADD